MERDTGQGPGKGRGACTLCKCASLPKSPPATARRLLGFMEAPLQRQGGRSHWPLAMHSSSSPLPSSQARGGTESSNILVT